MKVLIVNQHEVRQFLPMTECITVMEDALKTLNRGNALNPLRSGMHINAVGSIIKSTRELDTAAIVRSRLFVDRTESTVNEAGDYLFPKKEGAIDESHILGEIGDILLHKIEGRTGATEITLFKSLGLAVEDLAATYYIYRKLEKTGKGNWIDFGDKKTF